jgi:hypothetical protein
LLADGYGRRRFRGRQGRGQSGTATDRLIVDRSESVRIQDHGLPGVRGVVCIDGLEIEVLRGHIPRDLEERWGKVS